MSCTNAAEAAGVQTTDGGCTEELLRSELVGRTGPCAALVLVVTRPRQLSAYRFTWPRATHRTTLPDVRG